MAKMTSGTVLLEVSAAELDLIRRGLEALRDFAGYDDQADLDALLALRDEIGRSDRG